MTNVQIENVHRYQNHHGKWVCYYRVKGRKKIRLYAEFLSVEWWAEYNAAKVTVAPPVVKTERVKAGTFHAAINGYFGSMAFAKLGKSTQYTRRRILKLWANDWGDGPVAELTQQHIKKMLEVKTPGAERDLWKSLRALLKWCKDAGLRDDNPSTGIERETVKSKPIATVTEEEIEQYRRFYPLGSTPRIAFELALYTGQRGPSDITRLGWQHVKGGKIRFVPKKTEKTQTVVVIPIHKDLAAILATLPRTNMTFVLNEWGRAFTSASFGNKFRDWFRAAGIDKSSHGLRKAMARRIIEAGGTAHDVMSVLGLKTLAHAQLYAEAYNREKAAERAIALIS